MTRYVLSTLALCLLSVVLLRAGLTRALVDDLLATGGTIAGCAADSATLNDYTAGVLGGDALLAAVPQLQELAAIDVEQVANVDSADLLFAHWRALVLRIREAFRMDPELAGVVITHGTNTLEETAWLLELLIDDPRPVVLVGAMRPATALSADGPLNLLQALQLAVDPQAVGRGVLVLMDGVIHGAREVTKAACAGVGAFRSPGHATQAGRSRYGPTRRSTAAVKGAVDFDDFQSVARFLRVFDFQRGRRRCFHGQLTCFEDARKGGLQFALRVKLVSAANISFDFHGDGRAGGAGAR